MILDRSWDKKNKKFIISYIDKQGRRQFFQKYLHHIKTYEYDDNGKYDTWNNRKCNVVYKDTQTYDPNEFDLLEYMYELPDDLKTQLYAQNFPRLYTFDIETEYDKTFPDPAKAEHKVTAISLVGPDMSCIVYGLKPMSEESIELFRKRYLDWIENNDFARKTRGNREIKVLYQYFKTEEEMLEHFFTVILPKVPCIAGWNSIPFDWRYLVNRIIKLFGRNRAYNMIRKSSPTGEIQNYTWADKAGTRYSVPGPRHTIILDYQAIVEKYDYVLRPYESYKLEWVAEHAVNGHKIEYEGDLQYLYEHDYEWYYFYNAIDSLLTLLIHYKLKPLESPCAVSSLTLVSLLDAFGQVALTTANVFYEFYNDGKHVVWDYDAVERVKIPYEGAFCGCVTGRWEYCVCYDFKSLYPMQVQTCNLSFENFLQKTQKNNIAGLPDINVPWSEEELEQFKKDKNYFVSLDNHVYKNDKDYAFKRLQHRSIESRDVFKYTGQKIEAELITKIDELIEKRKNEAA